MLHRMLGAASTRDVGFLDLLLRNLMQSIEHSSLHRVIQSPCWSRQDGPPRGGDRFVVNVGILNSFPVIKLPASGLSAHNHGTRGPLCGQVASFLGTTDVY